MPFVRRLTILFRFAFGHFCFLHRNDFLREHQIGIPCRSGAEILRVAEGRLLPNELDKAFAERMMARFKREIESIAQRSAINRVMGLPRI